MVELMTRVFQWTSGQPWNCAVKSARSSFLRIPRPSTFFKQERSIYVPPPSVDMGLLGLAAYYMTKLAHPDQKAVTSIFGPLPGSFEERFSETRIRCIAQKGAARDAPENTMTAFKYCMDKDCKFVEIDVRSCKDGKLLLLENKGLERLSDCPISDVKEVDWEVIRNVNVAAKHPKKQKYETASLCLLEEALDFLLEKKAKVLVDIRDDDQQVINGILNVFAQREGIHNHVAITCANPWTIYKIRSVDPEIVAALKYEPYSQAEDGNKEPTKHRYGLSSVLRPLFRCADMMKAVVWRRMVRWCGISAVLLHKDLASPFEVRYWRNLDVRCIGLNVDTPMEKLYWRRVLKSPYIANTLVGEPDLEDLESLATRTEPCPESIVDTLLEDQTESRAATATTVR